MLHRSSAPFRFVKKEKGRRLNLPPPFITIKKRVTWKLFVGAGDHANGRRRIFRRSRTREHCALLVSGKRRVTGLSSPTGRAFIADHNRDTRRSREVRQVSHVARVVVRVRRV